LGESGFILRMSSIERGHESMSYRMWTTLQRRGDQEERGRLRPDRNDDAGDPLWIIGGHAVARHEGHTRPHCVRADTPTLYVDDSARRHPRAARSRAKRDV
jgi:hypothetical protein